MPDLKIEKVARRAAVRGGMKLKKAKGRYELRTQADELVRWGKVTEAQTFIKSVIRQFPVTTR